MADTILSEVKKLIKKKTRSLNKKWKDVAEKERGPARPVDYLEVGNIDGGINALAELMVEIDRLEKKA